MTFVEAIQSVLSNYANFSGRARRSEYWYFVLLSVIVSAVLGVLAQIPFLGMVATLLSGVWSLAIIVPSLALGWRRLHDIGKSGIWFLIVLVPLVGEILLFIWMCKDSQPGENQYGPNPKGF